MAEDKHLASFALDLDLNMKRMAACNLFILSNEKEHLVAVTEMDGKKFE